MLKEIRVARSRTIRGSMLYADYVDFVQRNKLFPRGVFYCGMKTEMNDCVI